MLLQKIQDRAKAYFRKSSRWKIAGDSLFYVFILLLIIPATRKPVASAFARLTMFSPNINKTADLPKAGEAEWALAFEDAAGQTQTLQNYSGDVILLNFWATWCPPCRAEMPSMQKLYDDYGDRIKMVLISSEERAVVEDYINEQEYTMPWYIQRSALSPGFEVNSIPTSFLISKSGDIVLKKKGAANWNSRSFREELDKLLAE